FLDDITQQELDDAAKKLRPNATGKTRNREVYTPFISVYTAASKAGKAPERSWRRPEGAHRAIETNAPSDGDIKKLIAVASDLNGRNRKKAARNKAALYMLTLTGERTTAATVELRWRNIDFGAGTVLFANTKNKKPRLVMLPRLLISALKEWAEFCKAKDSDRPDPEALVFGWKTRTGMSQMVAHARERAKLGKIRPHDIGRHSFGRRMRQKAKLDRPKLKKAGNWLSDSAVERYDHFELDEVSEAVRDVDTSELE
ncbi:tyrosine-type recombinase/integrase, partial [Hyphomicrobium sp.]|uniref:tyrosine-type recombinase/integrase n=1 Tax=Hyphomicrobium sp. TaxID=82 RepID=UPI002CF0B1CC